TYAAVTANHHLDLKVNGIPYIFTFTGAENNQAAFFAVINGVSPSVITATNAAGQTQLNVIQAFNGILSGEVLASSSADVLASLGLAAGVFTTPATVTALVDQS